MEIKTLKPKDQLSYKTSAGAKKRRMPKVLRIILCVLLIAFLAFGAYAALSNAGYIKVIKLAWQMQNQQQADQKVLAQLKKIILLPDGVTPTMAVITDIDALKKQQPAFFANAKNNDRLIIYSDQAIIFDAAANKIIKVGPVQLTQNQQQAQPVNFAIYNSLKDDPGNAKTAEMEAKIKAAFNNAAITVKANSSKFDYPKTLVIDVAGNNPDMEKISQAVGGNLSGLPIGEKKPEGVAVLVIIGKE